MITERFLMGRNRDAMSDADKQLIEDSIGDIVDLPPRTMIVRRGELVTTSTYLIEGHVVRYMDDRAGHRQLVAMHVPGDFFDLHGFPMRRLDHDVATLGPAKVAHFPHETLLRVTDRSPTLTRMLWFSTLLDAATHREWIFRLGRLNAEGRIAHFFCELVERMAMVGLSDGTRIVTPLTQLDLAEACGITAIHVNRTVRQLRETSVLRFKSGVVDVLDPARLKQLAEFDGDYLYAEAWRDIT